LEPRKLPYIPVLDHRKKVASRSDREAVAYVQLARVKAIAPKYVSVFYSRSPEKSGGFFVATKTLRSKS